MKKGDIVSWKWGKAEAEGEIVQKHEQPVTKKMKGTEVRICNYHNSTLVPFGISCCSKKYQKEILHIYY